MKVALLQVVAFLTEPELVYHVLKKGFDFVFYHDAIDGGGVDRVILVIRKYSGPYDFDNWFYDLLGEKMDEEDCCVFSGFDQGTIRLDKVKEFFLSNGAEVKVVDIRKAESIKDIDSILSAC